MLYNPFLSSSANPQATPPAVLGSPIARPGREPLRHILLGSEARVTEAVQQLHVLRYAEQFTWSDPISPVSSRVIITLSQGDIMRYLIRWRIRES